MQTAPKKVINGWAMYDWANSVYNLVITSTIFPAFFEGVTGDGKDATDADKVEFMGRTFVNTSLYNYALAFAILLVAICMPILSSIADYRGNKKKFLSIFSALGSIACMCLFFFTGLSTLYIGIIGMIIACFCYWASLVFYNSYLPEIAAPEDRDRISAKGFSYGYVGSVILQLLCFVLVFVPSIVGGTAKDANGNGVTTNIQFQVSFLLVGVWWFIFSRYSLSKLPKGTPLYEGKPKNILTSGFIELKKVFKELTHTPILKKFLGSFFFISMGVQTIMLAATLYGKTELGIPTSNLIIAILIIQLVAIGGAIGISKLSGKIGNFNTLLICTFMWVLLCVAGYLLPKGGINEFYVLAFFVGIVMGGIQSLTRSTFAKLMPETKDTASYFSFYDVTEKIAIVIGMFSFGFITELTGSQRNSVLAVGLFFITGLVLLFMAKKEKNI
jgi:MFS transporter, UMF1 family